ncbi:cytochrome c oxidase subunit II [Marinicauda algicola]|uniref:cytochrome-c oxidase n=1 Tax=Marinicauda algicola TaxID=2029849 RepID=A0A4S2H5U0_9PROT|nr:cytochrome c oxidase subunit II [Marinicauda algicola]TGY90622.1 cytochrome c oxidase subunit II [Marinicauda algicola]
MRADGAIPVWPEAISAHADSVDALAIGFFALIWTLALPIGFAIVWFGWRYRRLNEDVDRKQRHHGLTWLELSWMIVPFLLALVFFTWSALLFRDLHRPPADAREVYAIGLQWMWKFEHPGGQREINTLHVPAGEPVRVIMNSQDVIHSLYLPELRIKQDVVPGRTTSLWFRADDPGSYSLRCAEYCGVSHSRMVGELVVMAPAAFEAWLAGTEAGLPLARAGEALFRELGCSGCHGANAAVRAPGLADLYRRPVPLASGETVIADERYLTDSILMPESQVVAGYEPVMPSFQDVVTESELVALVAYIKSLSGREGERE